MLSNGVEEKYITGDASDYEKFEKSAQTLPPAIGNPMYHWYHLELKNYFGYTGVLNGETAREVLELCNDKLQHDPAMSARGLILGSNVAMVGTTDDPCSDLIWHEKLAADSSFPVQVCPSFRPDPAVNLHKPGFAAYLEQLEKTTGRTIATVDDVRAARYPNLKCIARHVRYAHSGSENSLKAYMWYQGQTYESRLITFTILDRVGGGDAFASGLIYAMMKGWSPEETVNFAVASSVIKHTIHGDGNITDDADTIRAIMNQNYDIKR